MTFLQLDQMPLADYVAALAQDRALWIFQHIPKTAGTSLSEELGQYMAPYRNIFVDYEDADRPFLHRLTESVDRFLADQRGIDFRSCSGHLTHDLVARIRLARPDARVVTFLRNPVDRVISDYRYQCSPLHPGHEAFREAFPDIEDYVTDRSAQNKMAFMIWGSHDIPSAEALIAHAKREFAFIGLVEMYALSFSVMMTAMGRPQAQPRAHARKTPDTDATRIAVTPELRAEIGALNHLDQALYDAVHATLVHHRADWWASRPAA